MYRASREVQLDLSLEFNKMGQLWLRGLESPDVCNFTPLNNTSSQIMIDFNRYNV